MKLRNKQTGKIGKFCYGYTSGLLVAWQKDDGFWEKREYNSLAELNEEWEDMLEEPKVGYIIDPMEEDYVSADDSGYEESDVERAKELGIWLETKEEAEKAVEKLKAFKRLKDKGFEFRWIDMQTGQIKYSFFLKEGQKVTRKDEDDLLALFGGEE